MFEVEAISATLNRITKSAMKGVQKENTGQKSLLFDLRTKELFEVEVLSAFQNRIIKCEKLRLEMEHWRT